MNNYIILSSLAKSQRKIWASLALMFGDTGTYKFA